MLGRKSSIVLSAADPRLPNTLRVPARNPATNIVECARDVLWTETFGRFHPTSRSYRADRLQRKMQRQAAGASQ